MLERNGLGSVSEALDGSGNVTFQQLFTPYGTSRYSQGGSPTTYAFTGQRSDKQTGLDYFNARYYDPTAQTFISADSVPDGLNRYAYVHGNPETYTDPSGHICANATGGASPACGIGGGGNPPPPLTTTPTPPTGCQATGDCGGGSPPGGAPPGGCGGGGPQACTGSTASPCDSHCLALVKNIIGAASEEVQDFINALGFLSGTSTLSALGGPYAAGFIQSFLRAMGSDVPGWLFKGLAKMGPFMAGLAVSLGAAALDLTYSVQGELGNLIGLHNDDAWWTPDNLKGAFAPWLSSIGAMIVQAITAAVVTAVMLVAIIGTAIATFGVSLAAVFGNPLTLFGLGFGLGAVGDAVALAKLKSDLSSDLGAAVTLLQYGLNDGGGAF